MPAGGAPAAGKRLQSCPHRAHAAAPGAAFAGRVPRRENQTARRCGFRAAPALSVLRFFQIEYALGIPANCVFRRRAEPRQKRLKRRYRRTQLPQRSFSSFRHRARSWPRQRRICYKAEHSAAGTNLRFVITNCPGRASQVFAFYNDRGECENRIEEFQERLPRRPLELSPLSGQCFPPAAARRRLQPGQLLSPAVAAALALRQIETLRAQLFKIGARVRQTARCIRFHLASGWPFQSLFRSATLAVNSS